MTAMIMAQIHYKCLTIKSSSEVDGIVLQKRQRSPLYPDFPLNNQVKSRNLGTTAIERMIRPRSGLASVWSSAYLG